MIGKRKAIRKSRKEKADDEETLALKLRKDLEAALANLEAVMENKGHAT